MSRGSRQDKRPTRKLTVSDDEASLFRELAGPVTTETRAQRRRIERPMPSARPLPRELEAPAMLDEPFHDAPIEPDTGLGDDIWHRQNGIQYGVMRRLRRGHYGCHAEIDLHGMIVDVARQCLSVFLRDCLDRGHTCIRIVHGKGLSSGNRGPVLKNKVSGWLRQRPEVLAYCSARQADGGTGALYVLLKRPKPE